MNGAAGPSLSRERAGMPCPEVERTSVVVVGAGPVGLVTAIELHRRGVRVVVLDAKSEITWSSRAICISRRSQEILDRIGAGPAFAAKALPWSRGRTFYRDQLVFQLDMPFGSEHRHAPFVNLQQSYTERFLLDTLGEPPGAPGGVTGGIPGAASRAAQTYAGGIAPRIWSRTRTASRCMSPGRAAHMQSVPAGSLRRMAAAR